MSKRKSLQKQLRDFEKLTARKKSGRDSYTRLRGRGTELLPEAAELAG